MFRGTRFFGLVIALALTPSAALAQADRAALLRKRQNELRQQTHDTTVGLRELPGTYKLADVFRITCINDAWVLSTTMRPNRPTQPARLSVGGLEGHSVLTLSDVIKNNIPESFTFTHTSFTDSRAVQVSSHVTISYGTLSLGRYAQLLDGYHNVTLSQGNIYDDDPTGQRTQQGVKFSVQVGDSQGTSRTNITYVARDFKTLRREHPREVDYYLRPLLRHFQIESLLAADPLIAWQVFAGELQADEAAMGDVKRLLPALEAESFVQREKALVELQKRGLPVAVAISHLDRRALSDQQNVMLDAVMAPFRPRGDDLSRLKNDRDFLLDCLYSDDLPIRTAAKDALANQLGERAELDVNADLASRSAAIDAIRIGRNVAAIE